MDYEISVEDFWRMSDRKELKEAYFLHRWDWVENSDIPVCRVVTGVRNRSWEEVEDTIRMKSTFDFSDGSSVELKDDDLLLYGEHFGVKF